MRLNRSAISDALEYGNHPLARINRLDLFESVREMRRGWLSSGDQLEGSWLVVRVPAQAA